MTQREKFELLTEEDIKTIQKTVDKLSNGSFWVRNSYGFEKMVLEELRKPVTIWIARDADGGLYSYDEKPVRQTFDKVWLKNRYVYLDYKPSYMYLEQLDPELYPELTWEDEPIEVEI